MVGPHEPKGNRLLRQILGRGFSSPIEAGLPARSQLFQGVAVPGTPTEHPEDWLVAK